MHAATLEHITDLDTLRRIALQSLQNVAERDAGIAERDAQIATHLATLAERDHAIHYKDTKIAALTAEIARLRRVQFAARSERMDPEQRALFDETLDADIAAVESELEALQAMGKPEGERKAKAQPKRRPLPPELPRIETRHEPASCDCAKCGAALVQIGEHVSEKLDCKPLEFFVRLDVYPQYACRGCETIVA